ncbi:monocarboxylate transporter 13-like [Amphiura filiformis]|uniref:monocarboxylate transporter 13-like n=1 Tax=Amphiura filiformis TaxID=82378 RepID=UPI003B22431A
MGSPSSSEDSTCKRSAMCRMNELPCRLAKGVKWFKEEPKRLGWIITISCFIFYTASYSLMYGFSLLFTELINEFDTKVSVTGYVGCLMSATAYLVSPITAFLLTKISHRSVCILGSIFCAIGAFTSSFVPSITYLFLTLGIIYGIGVNFLFHASLCLQLQYFPVNSERPVTVASAGFSASWMVTLPLLHYFIRSYGWRIAMQLISAVILVLCLVSCIPLCPLPSTQEDNNDSYEEKDIKKLSRKESLKDSKNDAKHDKTDSVKPSEPRGKIDEAKEFLGKPETWMFLAATAGTMSGWSFYFVNIVNFLQSPDTVGLSEGQSASIIFMCGIGEIAGKLVLIAIAGVIQSIPSIYVAVFGNILDAIFTIGLVLSSSYISAASFVVAASFGRAIWHIYPITGGVEELKNSNCVSTIFLTGMGVGYIIGSFLVGGLHDLTGSYETPMVLVAGVFALAGLFFGFVPLVRYVRTNKHKRTHGSYYTVSIDDSHEDCDDCDRHTRKLSKQEKLLWTCDHRDDKKTVLVEDKSLVVDSLMSSV